MLALVYLSLLAGLFALVNNLQTVLAFSGRVIDRLARGPAHRTISGRRLRRAHKKTAHHGRLARAH
jgi:hypothetical protein